MSISVGVVIPTFNRPLETLRAVRSVLAQTRKVDQIIVVDDGSTSANLEALRNLMQPLGIKLLELTHSGNPGMVRKKGLEVLETTYVAFLDSDDQWQAEKIEKQIGAIRDFGYRAVCSNAEVIGHAVPSTPYQDIKNEVLSKQDLISSNKVICSSALVERELLLKCGGFADNQAVQGAEDYATWLRISHFAEWKYLDEMLVTYSKEDISHFSQSSHERPEIRAYLDFIAWRYAVKGTNKFISKLSLLTLRAIMFRVLK